MLPAAAAPGSPTRRRPATLRDPATALRVALAVGWLLLALATLMVGQRPASLDDLRAAVDAGRVTEVRVSEGSAPDAQGNGVHVQSAVWRDRLVLHRIEAQRVDVGTPASSSGLPVLDSDLAEVLRTQGVQVRPLEGWDAHSEVLGWRVPEWIGLLLFAEWVATLFLLVGGPVPERATRWAWFWLSSNPLGLLAFLLLSGPSPGVPTPRPGARRLTGGWAFLVGLVLGGAYLGGS